MHSYRNENAEKTSYYTQHADGDQKNSLAMKTKYINTTKLNDAVKEIIN